MGGRRDDDEEYLPDYESPPPPEEPLDPLDPLQLGPFTPSADSRNGRSTNSSAGSAALAAGPAEGPVPDEDGVLSLNPLDEPMTDSSFPDDEPRPGRMDRWGRRERRGFRFQRWLEHADTPGDPCPVRPIEIVADDVARFCDHQPLHLTLPPNVARDAHKLGLIENVDIEAKFVEVTQSVQAPGEPQQSNNWQLIYQEWDLLPTEEEPDRETHLLPHEWKHGSSEYRALLGTYIGRVVVYMILGACPGRFKITRVVTWYTEDEEEDTAILQMRFDLEWIPVSTPPLGDRSLDPMGKPDAGPPPATPILPPVFGTPKAGSVTQRIKLPRVAPGPVTEHGTEHGFLGPPILPNSPEDPRLRQKVDEMDPDDPDPEASLEYRLPPISESPPGSHREPVFKTRKRAHEPALAEPAPERPAKKTKEVKIPPGAPKNVSSPKGGKPSKRALAEPAFEPPAKKAKHAEPAEGSQDIPKAKPAQARGKRGRFAKQPAPDPPAKKPNKAKVSPGEPKKTSGKRNVSDEWERPKTRAREAAEKRTVEAPTAEKPAADPADRTSKICKRCRQEWPLDQFQSAQRGGPETKTCQQCRATSAKKMVATSRRERPAEAADLAQPSSKQCHSCSKEWPMDQFQPLQTGGPITKSCKQCRDTKGAGVQPRRSLGTS
ncbi:hypothetical protein N7451_010488 [Penicillium sp. IBT 35674x]|nr:hypothetical protein N7451_010488 [Penicillium sp. IBT 35674x]